MKLVIRAEGPIMLESLVKPLQRIASKQGIGAAEPAAAKFAGCMHDLAEWYREGMDQERWQREAAALRELMTSPLTDWCRGKLYVETIAVPFGLPLAALSLLSGLAIRETEQLEPRRDFSPLAVLWLKEVGAKPMRGLAGELVQVEGENNVAAVLLKPGVETARADGIPVGYEQRQHADEHIDEGMAMLQANIDDASPEWLSYLMEQCFLAGANDVHFLPVTMKKSRAATLVQVMCYQSQLEAMKTILFRETTTFGIRSFPVACHRLARRFITVQTSWGDVAVKLGYHRNERVQIAPEYEHCAQLARANGVPLQQVYQEAVELAARKSSVKIWADKQEQAEPPKN